MSVTCLTGKLGAGKSKRAVFMIREALASGRLVATNLDVDLGALLGKRSRATLIRLPDKPSAFDLGSLPHGNPSSYDEDRNGVLVLDELGTWLNTRNFQDKGRAEVIDWLLHSRKLGWDVVFLVQGIAMIDKQVRDNIIEYVARCQKFDKIKIPVFGAALNSIFGGRIGYLPKGLHLCVTRLGCDSNGLVASRAIFSGQDLQNAYDTRQVFRADYPHGAHSLLSPWYLGGHSLPPPVSLLRRIASLFRTKHACRSLKPKLPAVAEASRLDRDAAWSAARAYVLDTSSPI